MSAQGDGKIEMKYNSYGTNYELEFVKGKYLTNNTLAIQILGTEEGKISQHHSVC